MRFHPHNPSTPRDPRPAPTSRCRSRRALAALARLAALAACLALAGCAQTRLPAIDPTGRGLFSGTTTLAPPSEFVAESPWLPRPAFKTPSPPPPCAPGQAPPGALAGSDGWFVAPWTLGPAPAAPTVPAPTDGALQPIPAQPTFPTQPSFPTRPAPPAQPTPAQPGPISGGDLRALFPQPATVALGQPAALATRLAAAAGGPLAGWIVRYELQGEGVEAGFGPEFARGAEVVADAEGTASVELRPRAAQAGARLVRVLVYEPAANPGASPRLVGQAYTSVTWAAPPLTLRVQGPASAAVGETITYRVEIANAAAAPIGDVVVVDPGAANPRFVSAVPAPQVFGDRREWRLGALAPFTTRVIEIQSQGERPGDTRYCLSLVAGGQARDQQCAATRFFPPTLRVEVNQPAEVEVGQRVKYEIRVFNDGDEPLQPVILEDEFPAGLEHPEGLVSPIERDLGEIAPRDVKNIGLSFIVTQPGQWCHDLRVRAPGQTVLRRLCVQGAPARTRPEPPAAPAVSLAVRGPERRVAGQVAEFFLEVANSGTATLTNVRVSALPGAALEPQVASRGHAPAPGGLQWVLPRLAPGEKQTLQVNCGCLRADPAAALRAEVASDQGAARREEFRLVIEPAPATQPAPPAVDKTEPAPREPAPREPQPVTGELRVSIGDYNDPALVGQRVGFLIVIKNDRNVNDRDVTLRLRLSDGLRFEKITGPSQLAASKEGGRVIETAPIRELRAGEALAPYRIEATALAVGEQKVTVEVVSQRSPDGVTATEETTVNAK